MTRTRTLPPVAAVVLALVPACAFDPLGVWGEPSDERDDGDDSDDSDGENLLCERVPTGVLPVATAPGGQTNPAIAYDAVADELGVVYVDSNGGDTVLLVRASTAGALQGAALALTTTPPALAYDATAIAAGVDGTLGVSWRDFGADSFFAVLAASSEPVAPLTLGNASGGATVLRVDDRFAVAWNEDDAAFMRLVSGGGSATAPLLLQSGAFLFDTAVALHPATDELGVLAAGNDAGLYRVRFVRATSTGTPQGAPLEVATGGTPANLAIAPAAGGRFAVAWDDGQVFVRVVASDGASAGPPLEVGADVAAAQPHLVALADGGLAVAFTALDGDARQLRLQRLDVDGELVFVVGEPIIVATDPVRVARPKSAVLADGAVALTWEAGNGDIDVMMSIQCPP